MKNDWAQTVNNGVAIFDGTQTYRKNNYIYHAVSELYHHNRDNPAVYAESIEKIADNQVREFAWSILQELDSGQLQNALFLCQAFPKFPDKESDIFGLGAFAKNWDDDVIFAVWDASRRDRTAFEVVVASLSPEIASRVIKVFESDDFQRRFENWQTQNKILEQKEFRAQRRTELLDKGITRFLIAFLLVGLFAGPILTMCTAS